MPEASPLGQPLHHGRNQRLANENTKCCNSLTSSTHDDIEEPVVPNLPARFCSQAKYRLKLLSIARSLISFHPMTKVSFLRF
jgi:hypothetical protein